MHRAMTRIPQKTPLPMIGSGVSADNLVADPYRTPAASRSWRGRREERRSAKHDVQ